MARERVLRSITLDPETEHVDVKFYELVHVAASEGENDKDSIIKIPFECNGPFKAHKDLVSSMRSLRKHGLALLGISLDDESKQLKNWHATQVVISGDHTMKQSRAKLTLSVFTERTNKYSKVSPTGQVTMYPESDDKSKYHDVDKLTAIIEDIIEEAWSYLNGKYGDPDLDVEENPQLILFPEMQEA